MDGDGVDDSSNLNLTSSMGSVLTNNKNKESVSTYSGSCSTDSTSNKVASNISKKNIKSDVDNEADLFANECNISDVSVEKITENVDDIVSDLESLLGGPTDFPTLAKSEIKPAKIDLCEERTLNLFNSSNLVNQKNVSNFEQKHNEKSATVQEKKDIDDIVRLETNINEVPSISMLCNEVSEAVNVSEDNNMPGISAPEVKMVVEEIHIVETKNIHDGNSFNKEICKKTDEDLEEKCSSSDKVHQIEYENIEENIESSEIKDYTCDALLPVENTQNVSIVDSESVLILDKTEISRMEADHSDQLLMENNESESLENTIIEKNENLISGLVTASTRIITIASTNNSNEHMDIIENTELPEFTKSIEQENIQEPNSKELTNQEKDEKCSSSEIKNKHSVIENDIAVNKISKSTGKDDCDLLKESTNSETDQFNLDKIKTSTSKNVSDGDETIRNNYMQVAEINYDKIDISETLETDTSLENLHEEKFTDLSTAVEQTVCNDIISNMNKEEEEEYELQQKNNMVDKKSVNLSKSENLPYNEFKVNKLQNSEIFNSVIDTEPDQSTSMLYEELSKIKKSDSKDFQIFKDDEGFKNDNLECSVTAISEGTGENDAVDILSYGKVETDTEMIEDQKLNEDIENKCSPLQIESFQSTNSENIEEPTKSSNIQEEMNHFVEDGKNKPIDECDEIQFNKTTVSSNEQREIENIFQQEAEINMETDNDFQIRLLEKSGECSNTLTSLLNKSPVDITHSTDVCINVEKITSLSQLKEITVQETAKKDVIPSEVLPKIEIIDEIKAKSSVNSDKLFSSELDTVDENIIKTYTSGEISDAQFVTKPECNPIKSTKVGMVLLNDSVNTLMESEQAILDKIELTTHNTDNENNFEKPLLTEETESILPNLENIEIAAVNSGNEITKCITEPELPKTNLDNVDITLEIYNSNETCEENKNVQYSTNLIEDSCEENDKPISDNISNTGSSITEHNNVFDICLVGNETKSNSKELEGGENYIIADKQHKNDDSGNIYSSAEINTSPECKMVSSEKDEFNGDLEEAEQTILISKEADHDNSTHGKLSKSIALELEKPTLDTKQISTNTKSVNPCDEEYQKGNINSENNVFKVEEKTEIFERSDNITSTSELMKSCTDVNVSEISEHKNEIKEVEIVQEGNSAIIKQSEELEQYINVTSENKNLHSVIEDQAEENVFAFSSDKEEMNSEVEESENILHGQASMLVTEPEMKHIHSDKIDVVPTKSENNDNEEYIKESNYSQDDELLKAALEASYEEDKPNSKEDRTVMEVFDKESLKSSSIYEQIEERNKHEENVLIQAAADAENNRLNHNYEKPLNIVVDPPIDEMNTVKEIECSNKTEIYNKQSGEYSSKISQNLKLTITKNKSEEKSILKIFDPKESDNSVVEISPSESDSEETPIPKFLIKQPQKMMSPLKITIKPVIKPEEQTQKFSPKLIIKPIIKPDEEAIREEKLHHSPKITIKPIPKPTSEEGDRCNSPKITIKPILKPIETSMSPKIKIKPIIKPIDDAKEEVEERIVLKITKNNISHTEVKKEENEKLAKIKLKFSKDNRHAHIVNEKDKTDEKCVKRVIQDASNEMSEDKVSSSKRLKFDVTNEREGSATVSHIGVDHDEHKLDISDNVIIPVLGADTENQDSNSSPIPTPRKRGRPRKNPLVVREEFKDIKEEVVQIEEIQESPSGRPKRSCRGPSVRTTLGIKPRKARGATRSRGRGRGVSTRGQIKNDNEAQKEISDSKIKLLKEAAISARVTESLDNQDVEMKEILEIPTETIIIEDSNEEKLENDNKSIITKSADVMIFEDETRMSAEINSRAQTPAKQVSMDVIEESQSSIQSTATTESTKIRKGTKMEIALEPEGAIISADQLAEYYWGGGGPYMLQEQVAQFLGIKSFKRKYPGIQRRTVDMQERDFIRESSLASEHMCDLGLTAVNSVDILDIMYSDFQNKYEEYCKHQRDRQTKDITNKQKALSLAASQEKNKLDIMQQAVESAAQWNYNFNKSRKEERIACMDLQTYTINYPKGRFKQINKPKLGYYPMALVPGQYTDFYKTFTPTELNNLPLSTMLYHEINTNNEEDSQSDNSASDSDSSSSGSDSSDSDSSDETDCNLCIPSNAKKVVT
ncbi:PREDICTED: reticulocyte-binding protein 2 homolog a [Nicrophorus vespilloides]|uniref:Reticulocyte-binding protein 2 homolog a n=1 Tax=Nicrophorus vespilloides TaxID=110193 RepID=A0ABM1MDN1_NICVS|nr:PREDICTED: reticulocyte-binding protein 2 homolog a [Nicrophorus vespilloides]